MPSSSVLDASAVLAVVQEEPGADQVSGFVDRGAAMSAINLCEAVAKLVDRGLSLEEARARLQRFRLEVVPFDEEQAWAAGELRRQTRNQGLSLGDRACLALARQLGLPAVTADRSWAGLLPDVRVELIR